MSHLLPVALEARSQLVFELAAVTAWRQVGFENRSLRDEAFSDDSVDAGEGGAGQSVTVLYAMELADADPAGEAPRSPNRWWQRPTCAGWIWKASGPKPPSL